MCDTILALDTATQGGVALFGKNSDRPPNEAQVVEYHPPTDFDEDCLVKCTHISIPQVKHTYGIFISKPHWIWGAEMGANEHGVAIGNEAVFSKEEVPDTGLLGMDLLRLGLERGKTARETLDVITDLLEMHGQGGNCELGGFMKYHNSFIIADKKEGWVLETSARRWIASRVKDIRTISNGYTIANDWDLTSSDLIEHAIAEGWTEDKNSFSFADAYGNEMMDYITACSVRQTTTTESLSSKLGELTFQDFTSILRSHPEGWAPWGQEEPPICQHTSHARRDSSAGSQISELTDEPMHWFTGSSNPCFSLYWPFTFRKPFVYKGWDQAGEKFSEESFWWRRERVNRRQSEKVPTVMRDVHQYINGLQKEVYKGAHFIFKEETLQQDVNRFEEFFIRSTPTTENASDIDPEYLEYIAKLNSEAGIDSY